jgi:hypothetical protein
MFRETLKRYAQIDIRPRLDQPNKYDCFVRRHQFAKLRVQLEAGGIVARYLTSRKELVLRRRDDGNLYVEIDGHRALRFVLNQDGSGRCQLLRSQYPFRFERGSDGVRLVARQEGAAYALGVRFDSTTGGVDIVVGNVMIESGDLHPLVAMLAYHALHVFGGATAESARLG